MRFLSFLSVLFFSFNCSAYYQNKPSTPDPRCLSLGKTTSNSEQFFNPASSVLCRSPNLYVSYSDLYLQKELGEWRCSLVYPTRFFHTNISVGKFGYEHYEELTFSCGMAKRLSSKFALGYLLHLYDLHYSGCEENRFSLSADIGISYIPSRKFSFFFCIQNLIKAGVNESSEEITGQMPNVGFLSSEIAITDNSKWTIEVANSELKDWDIRNGMEYKLEKFRIRCGFFSQPFSPTLGVGFKTHAFSIDVSSLFHMQLGYSFAVGIGKTF